MLLNIAYMELHGQEYMWGCVQGRVAWDLRHDEAGRQARTASSRAAAGGAGGRAVRGSAGGGARRGRPSHG